MLLRAITDRLKPKVEGEKRLSPFARDMVYHGGYSFNSQVRGVSWDFNQDKKTADLAPYVLHIVRGVPESRDMYTHDTFATPVLSDVPVIDIVTEMNDHPEALRRMENVEHLARAVKVAAFAAGAIALAVNHFRQDMTV